MNFFIQNETDKYTLSSHTGIAQIARLAADSAKLSRDFCCLNITFTDDAGIEPVNVQFLNHEGPTDVISFDYLDDYDEALADPDDPFVLGDLLISLETAERQAKEFGSDFNDEAMLYIIHGILHLCGYDDHEEDDIREMRVAEQQTMKVVKEAMANPRVLAE